VRVELARRAALATDPEGRARLVAAARAGEGTPVTTIHGFCRRLLAAHPVAAGLDPRFRVLDAEEASRLASEAYEQALRELAATDADVVTAAAGYRWRLAGIIRAAHSDLRNRGSGRPELPPIQIAALEKSGMAEPGTPADVAHASAAYDALRRLLAAYGDRYEALCAARSGVDFDHLQLLALRLLKERRSIAEAQRERFDHLLVDEFQDTSPIQVELVRAIAGPGTRLFAVGDEHQSIYAFRGADLACFRRERERIRARAESSPEQAVVLPLSGSFRSDPDVVGGVNAVGAALLDDFRSLRVGVLPDGPPPGPGSGPAVELTLTRREGWGEDESRIPTARHDAPPSRVAEARFLAERLRELADDGTGPAGMVVLLRAFTNVDVYAEALELADLDPHVVGGRGYWSAQQVADALRLLACVANPLDDESLLGALASPACAASPDALWMLRRIAGRRRHLWPALDELYPAPRDPDSTPDDEDRETEAPTESLDEAEVERRRVAVVWSARIPGADGQRLRRFCERLRELRAGAALLPLDTLVERTLETFDYDLTTLLADEGRRRTANLHKLVRIATEYEAHDGRDLRGFLDHAATRAAFSDREAEAATATEPHGGVRVMTIHAAKGLEFETVAVADLGRGLCTGGQPPELRLAFDAETIAVASGEGPPPARVGLRLARAGAGSIDTEGYGSLGEDAADSEAEESGRLAYVAASRAERRLILSGVFAQRDLEPSEKPRRQRTALGCLLPALGVDGSDGQVVTVPAPEPRAGLEASFDEVPITVRVIGAGPESRARLSIDRRRSRSDDPRALEGTPPLAGLAEGGAAAARSLSYAALADYGRCPYRFLVERVVGLGAELAAEVPKSGRGPTDDGVDPGRARLGFGRAVHELLEWSARNEWRTPGDDAVAAALHRESADPAAARRASEMLAGWLSSPLLEELRSTAGVSFRPEVSFRIAVAEGTILRGTIDLLVSTPDQNGGTAQTIVDYKTDSIGGSPPAELAPAYELQRSIYAGAVAEATGEGCVRSAYVFLERPGEPLVEDLAAEAIASGRSRIEAVVGEIRASRFEPTPNPHMALCHDCPARDRLCPHPKELTGRASPSG
ncbi:MAG: UvrD-helicase domain-containing protein, partial [Actinomycetota bacterium]|nr:UvrD-helicase domain-containing protein [Actinomycetota bacterium]